MSLERIPLILTNRSVMANTINEISAVRPKLRIEDELVVYNLMRYFIPEFNPLLNREEAVAIQDSKGRGFVYEGSNIPISLGVRYLDELSGENLAYFCMDFDVKGVLLPKEKEFGFDSFYRAVFRL